LQGALSASLIFGQFYLALIGWPVLKGYFCLKGLLTGSAIDAPLAMALDASSGDPFIIQDGDVITLAFRKLELDRGDESGGAPADSPGPTGWGDEEGELHILLLARVGPVKDTHPCREGSFGLFGPFVHSSAVTAWPQPLLGASLTGAPEETGFEGNYRTLLELTDEVINGQGIHYDLSHVAIRLTRTFDEVVILTMSLLMSLPKVIGSLPPETRASGLPFKAAPLSLWLTLVTANVQTLDEDAAKGLLGRDLNLRLIEEWEDSVGDLCWEKGQGSLSRIDFILIPKTWRVGAGSSKVLYDVDFGQAGIDHFPASLEATAILTAKAFRGPKSPRIDVDRLQSPEHAGFVQAICQTAPAVPWHVDAHTHYDLFARHLVDNLALAFPAARSAKRKTFFSDGTWFDLLGLLGLSEEAFNGVAFFPLLTSCEVRAIQGDKKDFTHATAVTAAASSSKLEDGSIARDPEEAEARWIRHFSSIEAELDLTDYDIEASDILTRTQIEASIDNVIATLGLDPSVAPRLRAYVRDQSLIQAAGAPLVLSRMIEETNCDTWFAHGAFEGTATVRAGTRPGDNLADMIFSFLFAELLKNLRSRFASEGLSSSLPWDDKWLCAGPEIVSADTAGPDSVRPVDVTWMDDLALLVEDPRPSVLLDKITRVATATLDECMKATLVPNLAAGKTECVAAFYGPGSKKVATETFRGSDPSLPLQSDIWPDARLRLVSTYKHVGGLIQAGGGTSKEVRSRIGAAWAAFRHHRRQVFSSPVVHTKDKAVLFSAVVESTLFYGVGAWPAHESAATLKFQGALVGMARLMLRPRFPYPVARHLSGLYALACARILPAEVAISLERLRHFRLVASKGCADLWALLHAERSWLCQAQLALRWAGELRNRAGLGDPDVADWDTSVTIARTDARAWKRIVKQTKVVAGLVALWNAEVQQYHGLIFRQLRLAGAYLDDVVSEQATSEICAQCGQVFPDKRSWSHHAFKVHGRVREERLLVNGQQCPVCLRAVVAPTPGVGSRKFADGSKSQLPTVQAAGPVSQWSTGQALFEELRPSEEVLAALEDLWCHGQLTCCTYADVLEAYRKAFCCCCLQLSRLKATAQEWHKQLQAVLSEDEEWPLQWCGWHSSVSALLLRVSWAEWLVPDPVSPLFAVSTFRDASIQLPWLLFDHVALPLPVAGLPIGRVVAAEDPGVGYTTYAFCPTLPEVPSVWPP
ncbi:unnamed protein product, partial [Symbiodinium necroappetens]